MSEWVLQADSLSKRFGRKWALRDCTVSIPQGKVVALVGPNGAGKSTLLRLAAGLSQPTSGTIEVLGHDPHKSNEDLLRRIGYLDQERPLYRGFRVRELFRFGADANPGWDMQAAHLYVDQLGISLNDRVNSLSGGQQAQVALTMCLAKKPELLILDEPAAALDPVAREDLLRLLMRQVSDNGSSVILSTHALSDVESICDYLVILSHSRIALCDDVDFIVESHRFLSDPTSSNSRLPDGTTIMDTRISGRGVTHLVKMDLPIVDDSWQISEPTLDEIILAYLRQGVRNGLLDHVETPVNTRVLP
jgi:ABC-2 type transport system ATP-binding protein